MKALSLKRLKALRPITKQDFLLNNIDFYVFTAKTALSRLKASLAFEPHLLAVTNCSLNKLFTSEASGRHVKE